MDWKDRLFIPDGEEQGRAVARTTHLAVAAHQDDIEFMAYAPISECFGKKELWFCGVVAGDGAGSPRSGPAVVGEYGSLFLLGHPSSQIKDPDDAAVTEELAEIFRAARPRFVYLHNPADRHDTHLGTVVKAIAALRTLKSGERPERVFGCEVWRDLDWLCEEDKILLDCSARPNLARALSGVFDSQIQGGKRYDLAAEGRRTANATFSQSHACDRFEGLNYAMDLTPLMKDPGLKISDFVDEKIGKFRAQVRERAARLAGEA